MKFKLFLAIGLLVLSTAAMADTFTLTATGSGTTGSVTLNLLLTGSQTATPGVFSITQVSGTVNGAAVLGIIPNPVTPNTATTPLGLFYYNNLLYLGSTNPLVDVNGLAFVTNAHGEGNIFFTNNQYIYDEAPPAYSTWTLDNVQVAQTPEPASLTLMGSGLIGLAGFLRRKLAR